MKALVHLTINTNDVRLSPRSEVSAAAIAVLAPWTRSTDNLPLPVFRQPALVACARISPGWARLDIFAPHAQVAHAVLVWTPGEDARLWPQLLEQARSSGLIAGTLHKPTTLPWLAATLTPGAATLPIDTLMALGDLERCWAWAVLEAQEQKP